MNLSSLHTQAADERGFVLITSLIFLVVITLLAVSAINSSTLQERMASNTRDKSRARQAADATLRHGELLLEDQAFDKPQPPGSTVSITPADQDENSNSAISLKLWHKNNMFASDNEKDDPAAFLDPGIWKDNGAPSFSTDADIADVRYYVEDYDFIARDLNPDNAARADGEVIYRITARAQGENPAAIAVTQSLYQKRY